MKKNGFTFIEILGVITLLALLSIIILTVVDKNLKDSKDTLSEVQIENIKSAASMWRTDNIELIPDSGYYVISLGEIIDLGYFKDDVINPQNKEKYDLGMLIDVGINEIDIDDEYRRLQYIESTGTQYIDTGISYDSNSMYNINCSVAVTSSETSFSSYSGWNGGGIFGFFSQEWTHGYTPVKFVGYFDIYKKTDINFIIEKNLSSNTIMRISQGDSSSEISRNHTNIDNYTNLDYPIFAYTNDSGGLEGYIKMKLWNMKISVNGQNVRNFIPCIRKSDNEVGLYDLVGNKFYENNGTGNFEYGELE